MAGVHREAVQKQIHQDWANREYIEVITASIKRITDFLNSFGKVYFVVIRDEGSDEGLMKPRTY